MKLAFTIPETAARRWIVMAAVAALGLAGCAGVSETAVAPVDRAALLLSSWRNWHAAVDAAEYLSMNRTTDPREIAALIQALEVNGKGEFILREHAARALGLAGDPSAGPALIRRLTDDPDEDVRRAAAHSLSELKSKEAIPVLLARVLDPQEKHVVAAEAAEALGTIGDASVLPSLMAFRADGADSWNEIAALDLSIARLQQR